MSRVARRFSLPVLGLILVAFLLIQARSAMSAGTAAPAQAAPAMPHRVIAEGRVTAYPGADVLVGAEQNGTVVRMNVREKDRVARGEVIAELRAEDLSAEIAEARARVAEADADIRLFDTEVQRMKYLWEEQVGSRQAYDRAVRDLEAAQARRQTATASVERLEALVAETRIVSPIDGVVTERNVDRGEMVESGDPIATIADLSRLRVEAEIDEFDTARIRLGAPVKVTAEGFDGQWRGTVEEIPDAVTSRRLKPQDPSRPVDARVLLVKVALPAATPLKLGQRVEVEIAK